MTISFLDLGSAYRELREDIDSAVARSLASGRYIGGDEVAEFESAFGDYCQANNCVGVGNGLDALHLTLRALEIGTGDEVIVASNTYIATWLAVSMVGATPVPVEPDATHNIDPGRIGAHITGRTRAILATHLYGQPADLDPLRDIAREHSLKLVEDAAQAHGARYKGRRIGAHGDAVAWSFYPSKNLGAMGDAGAVTTNDSVIAERVAMLGNYGSRVRYVNDEQGVNSRLDPIQAAILSVKLRHLDEWNSRRAAIAALYRDRLADVDLGLPCVPDWAEPVWHQFILQSDDRDALVAHLTREGIETLIHYPIPPHLQQAYAAMRLNSESLPIATRLAGRVLSLPIGPHLSLEDAAHVADTAKAYAN